MKGRFLRALTTDSGAYEVTFETRDKAEIDTLRALGTEQELNVTVKRFRERRSLNANAYFHVLVAKIAEVMQKGIDEVKKNLVCDYGTVSFVARIPADANLEEIYTYSKLIGESKDTKKPCKDWYIFKPTHTLDKSEMARLIDGAVQEAKELGIDTRTPDEIANLLDLWEKTDE